QVDYLETEEPQMSDDALMRKIRDLKEDAAALHELRRTLQAQLDAANAELDLWRSGALSPKTEDCRMTRDILVLLKETTSYGGEVDVSVIGVYLDAKAVEERIQRIAKANP